MNVKRAGSTVSNLTDRLSCVKSNGYNGGDRFRVSAGARTYRSAVVVVPSDFNVRHDLQR